MTREKQDRLIRDNLFNVLGPYLFVFLWSTGFLGARYGLPYAEPFTFVTLRLMLTLALLLVPIIVLRMAWPRSPTQAAHIAVVGMFAHAGYLGGNFYAMAHGMPLGFVALVGALQPVLTAVLARPFLQEKIEIHAWLGLGLGLFGVVLVLWPKLGSDGVTPDTLIGVGIGVTAITIGTLYQKRYSPQAPLATGALIQFSAATLVMAPLAFLFETRSVAWTPAFGFALFWLGVVISLGAITLYWILVRNGEVAKVASMFYLTPPVTAVMAYLLFGEAITAFTIVGMGVAVAGVAIVTKNGLAKRKNAIANTPGS